MSAVLEPAQTVYPEDGRTDQRRRKEPAEISLLVHSRTQVCPTPHAHPKLDSLSLFPTSVSGSAICLVAWESPAPPSPPSPCTFNCYVLFTSTLPFPRASSPSSSWSKVLNKEHFSSAGDVWQRPETSLVITVCGGLHWHLACRGQGCG